MRLEGFLFLVSLAIVTYACWREGYKAGEIEGYTEGFLEGWDSAKCDTTDQSPSRNMTR